jgi:outer membrane protein TolC
MKREIAVILLALSTFCVFPQQAGLNYFIDKGLQNSPMLNEFQNHLLNISIDSLRTRAGFGLQVQALSNNSYAPVINGWGYDQAITNGVNIYEAVSVSKDITWKRDQENQYQALGIQYQSISNKGKISEQELKKNITAQYITAYGSWQNYLFNSEMTGLLRTEESVLKTLAEKGVYRQTEYLSFLVNLQQQELRGTSIKNKYYNDLSLLKYLCGITDTSFISLTDPNLELEDLPDFKETVFFEQFVIDSLKLQNEDRQIDNQYLPKVSLFADGGYYSSLAFNPYKNFGLNAGISLSIPIYDGGQKKMQHDKLNIFEQNRRSYRDFYLSQNSQQINRFLQQLKENLKLSEDISKQVNYARILIETYHKILEAGDIHMSDYIIAVSNYLTARNMMVENKVEKYQIINELNYWNRTN